MTLVGPLSRWKLLIGFLAAIIVLACAALALWPRGPADTRRLITVWHPMRPIEQKLLNDEFRRFEAEHPDVRVRALYKDIEELRSAFQAAALAGTGPELVYGPSDVLDTYHAMGIVQDMGPWFSDAQRAEFIKGALTFLPDKVDPTKLDLVQVGDRFGTHLALVYNRRFVNKPPTTTDELIAIAKANTLDENHDGRYERYGLVWSYTEPYFAIPFLTGFGGWVFEESTIASEAGRPMPALNTPQAIAAYAFIKKIHDEDRVVPVSCDYELADTLFKTGRAAMIINGDWSWTEYLNDSEIDAAVAPLPIVSATGKPMLSMVALKGYSLNGNSSPQASADAMALVRHMTSPEAQSRLVERLREIPIRKSTYDESLALDDPTYRASIEQAASGRLMPVVTELRAVWDAMRPRYQALLGGTITPEAAAEQMQQDALQKIVLIRRHPNPDQSVQVMQVLGGVLLAALVYWRRRSFVNLVHDWQRNRIAYLFALPAVATVFVLVIFPFIYNVILSLSNMSLSKFKDWQIIGLQNYIDVLRDPMVWWVFVKTLIWTVVSVAFHVGIGVMLAVALAGPIRGKSLYRVLLIIPWAVPAYITALTWRGMFDYEYGAVNLLLVKAAEWPPIAWLLELLHFSPPVNWLGEPVRAFEAAIVANVWLGFPFMMIVALGGLQGIPRELYEVARLDGASRWQQFWHVTLPLLKPVMVPAATLGAIWTFNNLNVIWLVSNGGEPQDSTHILVSYVYRKVFNLYQYGYGAALSMLIFALLLLFSVTFLRRTRAIENVYG